MDWLPVFYYPLKNAPVMSRGISLVVVFWI
jgi:hypothetical protein